MENKTSIGSVGKFNLENKILKQINKNYNGEDNKDVILVETKDEYIISCSAAMSEGIDFDLTYFPLKHLGYKAIVKAVSKIYAVNGNPERISVSLGLSRKFAVEDIDELFEGVKQAAEDYALTMDYNTLSASINGMTINVTASGRCGKDKLVTLKGAAKNDLICITGDLGAAFMGLHLLEREKKVFEGHDKPNPAFDKYKYILAKQLKPEAPKDMVQLLEESSIKPTSMTIVCDSLASDLIKISKRSEAGVKLFLNKLPISRETFAMADELNFDPVVAALNGGEDYELLFTVPLEMQDKISKIEGIDIIGHMIENPDVRVLITPDGGEIEIKAPGW